MIKVMYFLTVYLELSEEVKREEGRGKGGIVKKWL